MTLFLCLFVPVFGNQKVEISRFALQRNQVQREGVFPTDLEGAPPSGQTLLAVADLESETELHDLSFSFVDARNRRVLARLPFVRWGHGTYGGRVTVPAEPFRLRIEGHYRDRKAFHVLTAVQTPEQRTLPPEPPGLLDEKIRNLPTKPAPIVVPHARVTQLRHTDQGERVVLEFDLEVSDDGLLDLQPELYRRVGYYRFSLETPDLARRYDRGKLHLIVEMRGPHAPAGTYTVRMRHAGYQDTLQLRGSEAQR